MNNGQRPQYTSNPTFNQKKKSSFWQKKNNDKSNIPVNQFNQANVANNMNFGQVPNTPFQGNTPHIPQNNPQFAQQPFNQAPPQANQSINRAPLVYNANTYSQFNQNTQTPNQNMYNPQASFNPMPNQGNQGAFYNGYNQPVAPQFSQQTHNQFGQQFANNQRYNFTQRYPQNNNENFANAKKRTSANIQSNNASINAPKAAKSNWHFQSFAKTLFEWFRKPANMSLLCLFVFLPILFLLALSVHETVFKFAFIIGAIIALIWLFWKKPYSDGVRLTMTVTYGALMLIIAINLITGIQPGQTNVSRPNTASSTQTPEETPAPQAQPTVAAVASTELQEGEKTASQQRFEMFMEYWKIGKIDEMATLVAPSWASSQSSPTQALFNILSNRRPTEYTIENISGTDADQALTVTLRASINKFTSDELEVMRYQIIMLKENGIWYIDPSSLATKIKEETPDPNATPAPTEQPRTTVTPKPDGNTKLYYNSSGGSYYHVDPECARVAKKYLPLSPFLYSELSSAPFNKLLPCLECGAPTN